MTASAPFHDPIRVVVELVDANARLPMRATEHAAGYDVAACVAGRRIELISSQSADRNKPTIVTLPDSFDTSIALQPGDRARIPLGFRVKVPPGYMTLLFARSGRAWKEGLALANGVGLIDADYPEECQALVINYGLEPAAIEHGTRIAQMVFVRHENIRFDLSPISVTTNRTGGFESTGR